MKAVYEGWKRLDPMRWWIKMVEGNIYLQRKVLQNHQQSLNYPLYLLYGARSPVLVVEPKGILILDVLQNLFSYLSIFSC
jgi:hypothetical protein